VIIPSGAAAESGVCTKFSDTKTQVKKKNQKPPLAKASPLAREYHYNANLPTIFVIHIVNIKVTLNP